MKRTPWWLYIELVGAVMIYSCVSFFTRYASMQAFLSSQYIFSIAGAIAVLGIYAILWQQIIKRMPISDAYMFKGTGVIWTMVICYFFFGEEITGNNIIGSVLIIAGITLFSRS